MADAIPHAVLSEVLGGRIANRRVLAGVFLTFQFDPGFFEQEILPVVLDVPGSHSSGLRLVQLEDALRDSGVRLAVYYDANQLVSGDSGSAHLDIERVPVRRKGGVFHPKNVLLLLEATNEDEQSARSLLVGAMSANLTRSGWWENIEVAHFEEVGQEQPTRLKEDLLELLRRLKNGTARQTSHAALDQIGWIPAWGFEQRTQRFSQGSLLPHFHSGKESLPEFLQRCAGDRLSGCCLEVISPFFDDANTCAPLEDLIRWFEPKEVRVMLPRSREGVVAARPELVESVARLRNVHWGELAGAGLKRELSSGGQERFIHAKLYRFFTQNPKREYCLIGSPNLTRAAHQEGANWETALLVEAPCPRRPEFWLEPVSPQGLTYRFESEAELAHAIGTPLILRYHWDKRQAEACWDADRASPSLSLEARGVPVGQIEVLGSRRWTVLGPDWADRLEPVLKETSFLKVTAPGAEAGMLLVQEEGMSHKPSMLLSLSVAEILRYWAMLTPAQRSAFLEVKGAEFAAGGEGAALVARFKLTIKEESFFDRFAGWFHAFNCLEREVREHLSAGREKEATYRIFGRKYDSLGTLVQQALGTDSSLSDDVSRYVVFLCARQLCDELGRAFPDYWSGRAADVQVLELELARGIEVRARLSAKSGEMPAFLEWFDRWFLKRAQPREHSS